MEIVCKTLYVVHGTHCVLYTGNTESLPLGYFSFFPWGKACPTMKLFSENNLNMVRWQPCCCKSQTELMVYLVDICSTWMDLNTGALQF